MLKKGSRGESVKQLQKALGIKADGIFGPQTDAAVRAYQRKSGLAVDGIVGPKTQASLSRTSQTQRQTQSPKVKTPEEVLDEKLGPVYSKLYKTLDNYLDEITKRGQRINPEVKITPSSVARFMKQAETDLDDFLPYAEKELKPFYETQLKLARESFLRNVGYTEQELLDTEGELERQYTKGFRQLGEQAAEQGFALSGLRQRDEQELMGETQRKVDYNRRLFDKTATNAAADFAKTYGTGQLPSASIASAPKVGLGGFTRDTTNQPVYSLSPETYAGLTGEKEFEQRSAIRSRAAELEGAFRSKSALDQQRRLTL